jgi:hypothetical protein
MKTYTERGAGSDRVVMLDAFTITDHRATHSSNVGWHVHSLTPWARDMMADPRAEEIRKANRGVVLAGRDSGRLPTIQFGYGLGFERRGDAVDFLRDLERVAERYRGEPTYESKQVRGALDVGLSAYRLKIGASGAGEGDTHWLSITPAQLAAIERILEA